MQCYYHVLTKLTTRTQPVTMISTRYIDQLRRMPVVSSNLSTCLGCVIMLRRDQFSTGWFQARIGVSE